MRFVVAGLLLSLVACQPPAADGPTTGQASVASQASVGSPSANPISAPGFEALGTTCTPKPQLELQGALGEVECTNGRVSRILWHLADVVGQPPDSAVIAKREVSGEPWTQLLVTEDAVWMRTGDHARRVRGTTWMALPAGMDDPQRAEIQRLAGLPETPILKSGAAWKQALIQAGPIPPR